MKKFIQIGRLFYGISIIAFGVQQIIIRDFRPEILPPFPAWAHRYIFFPYITGIALIFAGVVICGIFKFKEVTIKKICLYLGFYFLALIIICHIPYCLILSPNSARHLGVWAETLKELAFSGGAFVMAGSFANNDSALNKQNNFDLLLEKLIPFGRIFFSITMILYGYAHFLYSSYVSAMVPGYFGIPVFWTYFSGAALICAGIAIIFRIWIKTIASLLAIMLFLWFILVHTPNAITHPSVDKGNEVVSAFDALLFCGTAIIIAITNYSVKFKNNRK